MTKADSFKPPTKRETTVLKVFIHCDQCQKQVKKVLKKLDGIESIVIDAEQGKVSVVGTVPTSTLVKKLSKAGKYAAPWSSISASAFITTPQPPLPPLPSSVSNRDPRVDHFFNISNPNKASAKQLANQEIPAMPRISSTLDNFPTISSNFGNTSLNEQKYLQYMVGCGLNDLNSNLSSSKKPKGGKRVSFGASAGAGVGGPLMLSHQLNHSNDNHHYLNNSNALVATRSLSVSGYRNMESVEFATSMFSDENANSCSIM